MRVDVEQLLARFLRYVTVDTKADPASTTYPSSPGQTTLAAKLRDELRELGVRDAVQDEYGLVYATVPATSESRGCPTIAWNAHVDTSPEAPGKDVRPQVIRGYAGGDLVLPGDRTQVIREQENPELRQLVGATLITTDGTTLLGADDKAGIAVIMQSVATLLAHPEIAHGPIRILFTCDEEIGKGVDHVDLKRLGADACYTLDGPAANSIDVETFSADLATVTITGINIHPSIAKDRMVNAIKSAARFLSALPQDLAPEVTADREGFVHPYQIEGQVDRVVIRLLLRDFVTERLAEQADLLRQIAKDTMASAAGAKIQIDITKQYRNLGDGLLKAPRVVELAEKAHQRLGRTAKREIIRGGTDGSRLTELGLPTPNLSCGQHTPHSRLEWACLEEMTAACEVLIALAECWAE